MDETKSARGRLSPLLLLKRYAMKIIPCCFTLFCMVIAAFGLAGCSRSPRPFSPPGESLSVQDHILYQEVLRNEQISIFVETGNNIVAINNQVLNPHPVKTNRYFVKAGQKYQVKFKCEHGARVYGVTKCYQTINFIPAGGNSYLFNCFMEDGFIRPYAENTVDRQKTPMNWNVVPCDP